MSSKWKNRQKPTVDHSMSLFLDETISAFVTGHLIIESLIVQIIDLKLEDPTSFDAFRLSFPAKINLCKALGMIDSDIAKFLLEINTIRNRFAHNLGFKLSFVDVFHLVQSAANSGVDFSDESMVTDEKVAKDHYGIQGMVGEVIQNTALKLAFIILHNGGETEFL